MPIHSCFNFSFNKIQLLTHQTDLYRHKEHIIIIIIIIIMLYNTGGGKQEVKNKKGEVHA